jgi:hypothetical protein
MSPEQGQGLPVDRRTDIYSLGIVLFEMLTGQIPHDSETPFAIVLKRITEPMPLPRAINPSITEAVERVILKALAKDPADRFASAGEMASALRAALAEVVTQQQETSAVDQPPSVPPTVVRQPAEPSTSRPGAASKTKARRAIKVPWWAAAASALALVVLVAVVLVATGVIPTQTRNPEPPAEKPALPPPDLAIVIDNGSPGFVIEAGEWGTCADSDCEGMCFGDDFRFADPGCTQCRARFGFQVPTAGEYDVWTWWPQGGDRATDTPFTIMHRGDPVTVRVDQQSNGSAWYLLGTFPFDAGRPASIMVEGSMTGFANADAVALTPAGSWQP